MTVRISMEKEVVEVWQAWGGGGFYVPFGEYKVGIGRSSGMIEVEEKFTP